MSQQEKAAEEAFQKEMKNDKKVNIGGLIVPLPEEDVAFLRAQKDSEHFRCFARCIKAYKDYCVNRLTMCKPEELLLAQGQLQGLNASINLLTHASTEFDIKG